ncbi:type VI secretion system tip protein VgrG, partial [Pseudomonas sp. BLCC-B112]|nr:type VI secretion system tip protein VgrG [Pseudomonas sp. BLCC-B112]
LQAGGQHIVISSGGIFSSVPIVVGGAPLAGIAPLQALQALAGTPQAIIDNPLSIVRASKQQAVDFCPLCEACSDGLCARGEMA